MIRHCVFVKFRADVGDDDKQAVYARLDGLRESIDGLVAASFGPNVSPEGLGRDYDDGFIMDFVDVAARDAYLVDADHRAAGQQLVSLLEGGRDGVLVFDLEI